MSWKHPVKGQRRPGVKVDPPVEQADLFLGRIKLVNRPLGVGEVDWDKEDVEVPGTWRIHLTEREPN